MRASGDRKNRWAAVLVIALAVAAFTIAGAVGIAPSHQSSSGPTSSQTTGAAPVTSGPITDLTNSQSGLSPTAPAVVGQYTVLPASQVPAGASPLPSTMTATVALKPSASLSALVNELNNPNNPDYRKFLTLNDVGAVFGSSSYAAVADYFSSYGLSVQVSAGLLTLSVSGTPSQMGAAFHTTLTPFAREYSSQGMWNPLYGNASAVAGNVVYAPGFYANTAPLALPASLTGVVAGVAGLGGLEAQPSISAPLNFGPGQNLESLIASYNASHPGALQPTPYTGPSNPNVYSVDQVQGLAGANFTWSPGQPYSFYCEFYGVGCTASQTLFPSTMHALTGASNLWSGATTLASEPDMGQGVTIAVIEVGCLDTGTVQSFSNQVWNSPSQPGLPLAQRLTQIGLNTPGGFFPSNQYYGCLLNGEVYGWTIETALDVEYAATMAPLAHIDIVATASADFSAFDAAYADIAQYLAGGQTTLPAAVGTVVGIGAAQTNTQSLPPGAGSITITSNSYGEGEEYAAFFGAPMYLTVEDTLLEEMNTVGLTNFFASGDYSGAIYGAANQAGMPAISPGSTSVGGGQTTAESNGQVYPVTSSLVCPVGYYAYNFGSTDGLGYQCVPTFITPPPAPFWCEYGFCTSPTFVAPATGLASFTYWSYGEGIGGTYMGIVGGGFGQSIAETQPWWQNSLDSYSTGAAIDPVISAEAAFNMTIFDQFYGGWLMNYGGTSFATPTMAGEWALVEEQANVAFGSPAMGDINPVLYGAHNAYEAGVSSFHSNPYVDMAVTGTGFDWGPTNSYNWYYFNLSIEQPYDPVLPWWFNTLTGPEGPGWNYLQGLGMPTADVLDQELIGQLGDPGHALTNPAFQVELVTAGGTLVPLADETLTAGTTYTLEVVDVNGQSGVYNIQAYSGQSSSGTYGGGTVTTVQTPSNGQFSYTPTSGTPPGGADATTYGYFLVTSVVGSEWSFADFAVAQPAPSGSLSLCVLDPQGICQTGSAEVTTFTTGYTGFYNIYPQAFVTLNGVPVASAVVTEVSVNVSLFQAEDPTMPISSYAPGATLGQFITGSSGDTNFWTDAFTAELSGYLPTQVVTLTASYGGQVSNTVTVFIEPQSGSFDTGNITLNGAGTAVVGTLTFSSMKDVNYVNASIGSSPGQYLNVSYPPAYYDSNQGVWVSGVFSGQLALDLSTAGLTGPIQLSLVGSGTADVSFSFCFFGFCYVFGGASSPIVWSDPLVYLPATLSASPTGTVQGIDAVSWSGTAYAGATGTLSLVSGAGATVLATGISGSYDLNTSALLDGYYSVVFTEQAPGAATTVRSVSLYADNQAVALESLVATLQSDLSADQASIASLQTSWASANTTIASLQSQVASLQASLSAANANLVALQAQVTSMNQEIQSLETGWASANATVSSLTSQLAADTATVSSLEAQITALQKDNAANATTVSTLNGELSSAQVQLSSTQSDLAQAKGQLSVDATQIASLQGQVQTLQNQLNAKQAYIAPAWYDTFPGGGLAVGLLFAAVGAALGALGVYAVRRRHPRATSRPEVPARSASSSEGQPPAPSLEGPEAPRRSREDVLRRAMAARDQLLREGDVQAANRIGQTAKILGDLSGVSLPPPEFESIYR